jgi:hypothetical protein
MILEVDKNDSTLLRWVSDELKNSTEFILDGSNINIFLSGYLKKNQVYTGKYYKYIKLKMLMHNFRYKEGLNIDTNNFNKVGNYEGSRLYFSDEKYIF